MFKLIVFLISSASLINISRASLRAPRSHGFYRFFAWEYILALFLLNVDDWFQAPFAWYQLVSWLSLALDLVPLILGACTLRSRGQPVTQREGAPQLLAFEKTSSLVTSRLYHYIRHLTLQFAAVSDLGHLLQGADLARLVPGSRCDAVAVRHGEGGRN